MFYERDGKYFRNQINANIHSAVFFKQADKSSSKAYEKEIKSVLSKYIHTKVIIIEWSLFGTRNKTIYTDNPNSILHVGLRTWEIFNRTKYPTIESILAYIHDLNYERNETKFNKFLTSLNNDISKQRFSNCSLNVVNTETKKNDKCVTKQICDNKCNISEIENITCKNMCNSDIKNGNNKQSNPDEYFHKKFSLGKMKHALLIKERKSKIPYLKRVCNSFLTNQSIFSLTKKYNRNFSYKTQDLNKESNNSKNSISAARRPKLLLTLRKNADKHSYTPISPSSKKIEDESKFTAETRSKCSPKNHNLNACQKMINNINVSDFNEKSEITSQPTSPNLNPSICKFKTFETNIHKDKPISISESKSFSIPKQSEDILISNISKNILKIPNSNVTMKSNCIGVIVKNPQHFSNFQKICQ